MSAFMCPPRTIAKVLRVMERRYHTFCQGWPLAWSHEQQLDMATKLVRMNDDALSARYSDAALMDEQGILSEAAQAVRFSNTPIKPPEAKDNPVLLRAIDCYLYQCNEGRIEETLFFHTVKHERALLAEEILTQLPEYLAAPWSEVIDEVEEVADVIPS